MVRKLCQWYRKTPSSLVNWKNSNCLRFDRFEICSDDVRGLKMFPSPSERVKNHLFVEDSNIIGTNKDVKSLKNETKVPAIDSAHLSPRHLLR